MKCPFCNSKNTVLYHVKDEIELTKLELSLITEKEKKKLEQCICDDCGCIGTLNFFNSEYHYSLFDTLSEIIK